MPFEVLDQRDSSTPSSLFSPERQANYLKSKAMLDYHGSNGMARTPTGKMVSASPLGKVFTMGAHSLDYSGPPQSFYDTDAQNVKPPHARREESVNLERPLWTPLKQNPVTALGFDLLSTSLSASLKINDTIESSLFSSSLSEMSSDKMRLSANKLPNHFGISVASNRREKERLESLKEIEAKCIGNLLPDGDDLFYGVGELEPAINVSGNADMGDFDLFSSGGGMELEGDDALCASYGDSHFIIGTSGGHVERYPVAEHPSRTLFVRNINSNVEESELRALFERYGDVQVLYMACKHRGFVLISYYDIRASQNAMNALHNRPLRQMKLGLHYSLPKDNPLRKEINHGILMVLNLDSSLSSDDLFQMFGVYGEIKKVHGTSHSQHHKFVEFYDIRAAEAAFRALNDTNVSGKQIMLKFSSAEGLTHCSHASEQDKASLCQSPHAVASRPWGNTTIVSRGIDTSMCMENVEIQGSHSQNHGLPFMDMGFSQEFFNVPSTLPAATVASSGSKYGETQLAINNIKVGHPIQRLQPQSLPEYQYSLGSNTLYNMGNTISNITGNHMTGEIDTRRIQDVGTYEHSLELISRGNRSSPLHVNGRHLGSLSYQHLSSSPISWQNSPPFLNGTHINGPLPLNGFPGSPFHMLPNMQRHHVGSAPAVNPTLWDRQHASLGSPNASGLSLVSLGSAGFLPVSTMNLPEVSPQSTLSQARRSYSEFSKKSALHSPQQTSHMLHGRNSKIPAPTSFHPSGERMRFRRNEAIFNQADKKEYGLDIECILCDGDSRTTLMIKNIPNKYTSKMLLAAIDENHRGTYDFVYLPIDFKNKCNVGYAFINMIDPLHIVPFYKTFEGKKWGKFNSEKVASLAYARIQGKAALIAHFQNSSLMNEDKRCRPILFQTEGPNAGDQEPFPVGTNVRSRPGKPRTFNIDESHCQKSPFMCNNADESNKRTDESSTSSSDQE